jgi:hypothetical protein
VLLSHTAEWERIQLPIVVGKLDSPDLDRFSRLGYEILHKCWAVGLFSLPLERVAGLATENYLGEILEKEEQL